MVLTFFLYTLFYLLCLQALPPYELVGVIEHMGGMRSGHYIAYTRRPVLPSQPPPLAAVPATQPAQPVQQGSSNGFGAAHGAGLRHVWFCISDTSVKRVSEAQVLQAQAYVLMYARPS